MKISVTRIVIKEHIKYTVLPRKYTSSTKLIYIDDLGEHHRYYTEKMNTFKKFVAWVKSKFGEGHEYDIDYTKPYVHYL